MDSRRRLRPGFAYPEACAPGAPGLSTRQRDPSRHPDGEPLAVNPRRAHGRSPVFGQWPQPASPEHRPTQAAIQSRWSSQHRSVLAQSSPSRPSDCGSAANHIYSIRFAELIRSADCRQIGDPTIRRHRCKRLVLRSAISRINFPWPTIDLHNALAGCDASVACGVALEYSLGHSLAADLLCTVCQTRQLANCASTVHLPHSRAAGACDSVCHGA